MTEAAPLTADAAAPAPAPSTQLTYYPQYCFHLSPTLNRWCPMRVADIVRLKQFADFEGQNVFFHLNHPVKWVRVAGVVVACAEYYGRRVYTVDDGSGATMECVVPQSGDFPAGGSARQKRADVPAIDAPGAVVDVKGELRPYRGALQLHIAKLAVLRGTEQEVQFWARVQAFARDTLRRPWLLDKRTVRACRKAAAEGERKRRGQGERGGGDGDADATSADGEKPSTDKKEEATARRRPSPPVQPPPRPKRWVLTSDEGGRNDADVPMEDGDEGEQLPRRTSPDRRPPPPSKSRWVISAQEEKGDNDEDYNGKDSAQGSGDAAMTGRATKHETAEDRRPSPPRKRWVIG